jgi:hypothetical protein
MKGMDAYVVHVRSYGVSEWVGFNNRREADVYASGMKGKGVKIKKWICRMPMDFQHLESTNQNDWLSGEAIKFIQQNYPHCVGEE